MLCIYIEMFLGINCITWVGKNVVIQSSKEFTKGKI